ncbi:hypothetical protein G9A89_009752 [Geosiphon pyriformis]|nr:hypothetical protein G9A89_009752 [Geosiphon pyriformis]
MVKKPSGGAKISSKGAALKSGGSSQVVGQFNSMDTDGEASKGDGVFDSKINTPQAKYDPNRLSHMLFACLAKPARAPSFFQEHPQSPNQLQKWETEL